MSFLTSAMLDPMFDTTFGAADEATISPASGSDYTAPVILYLGVSVVDSMAGIEERTTIVEVRKSDLADSDNGLLQGTEVIVGGTTYTIQSLERETTYTLIYFVSS